MPKPDRTESALRASRLALVLVAVIGAVAFGRALWTDEEDGALAEVQRVWSIEHGHWHVLGGGEDGSEVAPPGKVWSPEHGHWHDAPPLVRRTVRHTAMDERADRLLADAERELSLTAPAAVAVEPVEPEGVAAAEQAAGIAVTAEPLAPAAVE